MLRDLYDYHRMGELIRAGQRRAARAPSPASRRRVDPASPFFGMDGYPSRDVDRARSDGCALETLLRPEPDTRVTGLKEIRWSRAAVHRRPAGSVRPGRR